MEKNLKEEEMPAYRSCTYAHRGAILCARIRQFIKYGSTRTSNTGAELLAEAERFENEMQQSWESNADESDTHSIPEPFGLRVLVCRTFFYAFRLKFQLSMLELMNKFRVETHDIDSGMLQDQLQLHVGNVQKAADEILACVPLIFSTDASPGIANRLKPKIWIEGIRVLWPLRLVALWSATRDDQKQIAYTAIRQIRKELGVRRGSGAFLHALYGS